MCSELYLADRLGPRQPGAYALIPALAFLCIIPCYALGTSLPLGPRPSSASSSPRPWSSLVGPVIGAIQQLVPANMRALASSVFLFINNLLGLGLGSLLLGFASDRLAARYGSASLHHAILGGTIFYVLAAGFLLLAARRLARDFEPA